MFHPGIEWTQSQSFQLESQGSHTHSSICTHHMPINPHAPTFPLTSPLLVHHPGYPSLHSHIINKEYNAF